MSYTVTAGEKLNNGNTCAQKVATATASYVLDNTGPVVSPTATPAPNAAGWNKSDVSVTWSATDAGSGVLSGPTPASASATANYVDQDYTSIAADRLRLGAW